MSTANDTVQEYNGRKQKHDNYVAAAAVAALNKNYKQTAKEETAATDSERGNSSNSQRRENNNNRKFWYLQRGQNETGCRKRRISLTPHLYKLQKDAHDTGHTHMSTSALLTKALLRTSQ